MSITNAKANNEQRSRLIQLLKNTPFTDKLLKVVLAKHRAKLEAKAKASITLYDKLGKESKVLENKMKAVDEKQKAAKEKVEEVGLSHGSDSGYSWQHSDDDDEDSAWSLDYETKSKIIDSSNGKFRNYVEGLQVQAINAKTDKEINDIWKEFQDRNSETTNK